VAKIGKLTGATRNGQRVSPPEPILSEGSGLRVFGDALEFIDPDTGVADLRLSRGPGGYLRGATPVVEHDWTLKGWADFRAVTVNQDGVQAFTPTVSAGRGVVSAASSTSANHRVVYLREGTNWADSMVRSVIYGPTADWDGVNAQQGHVHRVRETSPGSWEGIAVWTSIAFGADYGYLHANGVRFDGTTLTQATNADVLNGPFGYGDSAYIDHRLQVIGTQRIQPLLWVNDYRVQRPDLVTVTTGDIVDIANFSDTTFNESAIAIQSVQDAASGWLRVIEGTSTSAIAYAAVKQGYITPSGVDAQKRWCPFHLATRVVGGTSASVTVQAKRWRLDEGAPEGGAARVQTAAVTPSANVPTLATAAGRCGLWSAHFNTSSGGAWGPVRFEQVT
jgi:hypothetical protein